MGRGGWWKWSCWRGGFLKVDIGRLNGNGEEYGASRSLWRYRMKQRRCIYQTRQKKQKLDNTKAAYSLLVFFTMLWPFASHCTASPTISSTISFALFFSFTTAAAFPIRNGRALSIVSSSMSSPRVSKSCSTGIVPLVVRSLISCARFSSQLRM